MQISESQLGRAIITDRYTYSVKRPFSFGIEKATVFYLLHHVCKILIKSLAACQIARVFFTSDVHGGYMFDKDNNKVEFKGIRSDCINDSSAIDSILGVTFSLIVSYRC